MIRELLRRLNFVLHRGRYERELEEEMAHHLAMLEQDRPGPIAARRQFGNVTTLKEESRDMWTFRFLEQTAQDLRYALRAIAAAPLFTITASLSLALGIGANTAIYSFMNAIMLRSLPVYQPDRLAIVEWHAPKRPGVVKGINGTAHRYQSKGTTSPNFPYHAWESLRAQNGVFDTLFAYTYVQNFNAIVNNQADAVGGGFVSGNYFAGLGVPAVAGRLLAPEDDAKGAQPAVVLTYSYWQDRFNGDTSAIDRSILLNNQPFTIVGVSAPGFFGVDPRTNPSVFLPIHAIPSVSQNPAREERSRFFDDHFYWIEMIGRLRPGITIEQAQAATRTQFAAFAASTAASPKDAEVHPEVALEPGGAGLDSPYGPKTRSRWK